jgi:hypothetical protein
MQLSQWFTVVAGRLSYGIVTALLRRFLPERLGRWTTGGRAIFGLGPQRGNLHNKGAMGGTGQWRGLWRRQALDAQTPSCDLDHTPDKWTVVRHTVRPGQVTHIGLGLTLQPRLFVGAFHFSRSLWRLRNPRHSGSVGLQSHLTQACPASWGRPFSWPGPKGHVTHL